MMERRRNYDHVLGGEFKEEVLVYRPTVIKALLSPYFNRLNSELFDEYREDILSIYRLENGRYFIDDGDFTIYVEIEDYKD